MIRAWVSILLKPLRNIVHLKKYLYKIIAHRNIKKLVKSKGGKVSNCTFELDKSCHFIVGHNVTIQNCNVKLINGTIEFGDQCIIGPEDKANPSSMTISSGVVKIKSYARLRANIMVRFGGKLEVGSYTAINEGSEIRCDELVSIGDFCMISYYAKIYDSNTHAIYKPSFRRKMTIRDFPFIGAEYRRPKTAPVLIGNDVWIGANSIILKGVTIGDGCIVGAHACVAKKISYPECSLIVNPSAEVAGSVQYDCEDKE
jgi:acetyltransferase-like isoleucine patch superfamily enzyme